RGEQPLLDDLRPGTLASRRGPDEPGPDGALLRRGAQPLDARADVRAGPAVPPGGRAEDAGSAQPGRQSLLRRLAGRAGPLQSSPLRRRGPSALSTRRNRAPAGVRSVEGGTTMKTGFARMCVLLPTLLSIGVARPGSAAPEGSGKSLTVAADGSGDYKTVQEA